MQTFTPYRIAHIPYPMLENDEGEKIKDENKRIVRFNLYPLFFIP